MSGIPAHHFGPSGLVLLFAAVQTLFLVTVLLASRSNRFTANRLLCVLLLTLALVLTEFALIEGRVTAIHPYLFGISLPAYFAMAPLPLGAPDPTA